MDSFQRFIQRIVFLAAMVLVIVLLVLMPAMILIALALGGAAALWMLASTLLQVARSADRELDLAWPGYLVSLTRDRDPREPADPGARRYDSYEDPYEEGGEEPEEDGLPVAHRGIWTSWMRRYDEKAARWQPAVEPTYRQYLLGQAWIDLLAALTDSGSRLFAVMAWVTTESDQRLTGEKRSSVLFPLRWAVTAAVAATVVTAVLVSLAVLTLCALVLVLGALAWLLATATLRVTEAVVAWARKVTMPCNTCDRQIPLPCYECGNCGARHEMLTPNKFGALWHPCQCGQSLPTTVLMGKWLLSAYCPFSDCAVRLPPGIGRVQIRHVPILGARQAGKSTLSCLMLRDLNQKLTSQGGMLKFEDARDEERLGLADGCEFISKTTPKAGLRPALITISHWAGKRQLLYFFDPAGEDIDERSELGQHAFISYMKAFVVTIDPLTIPAVAARLGPANPRDDQSNVPSSLEVLETLIGTLQDLDDEAARPTQRGGSPRITRVGVVVTKADLLPADQQEQVRQRCGQWLAEMGLRSQLETLEHLAGRVGYLPSGLSGGCSRADYATLALWISGLEAEPPDRPQDDGYFPELAGASVPGALGPSAPPTPDNPREADASARTEAESEADGADKAPPARSLLATSYRCGRLGLLALAVAGAACSWFVVLDAVFHGAYRLIP